MFSATHVLLNMTTAERSLMRPRQTGTQWREGRATPYHEPLDLVHGHVIQHVQVDVVLGLLGKAEPLRAENMRSIKPRGRFSAWTPTRFKITLFTEASS